MCKHYLAHGSCPAGNSYEFLHDLAAHRNHKRQVAAAPPAQDGKGKAGGGGGGGKGKDSGKSHSKSQGQGNAGGGSTPKNPCYAHAVGKCVHGKDCAFSHAPLTKDQQEVCKAFERSAAERGVADP